MWRNSTPAWQFRLPGLLDASTDELEAYANASSCPSTDIVAEVRKDSGTLIVPPNIV